jgi:ERCC4-type nuclease
MYSDLDPFLVAVVGAVVLILRVYERIQEYREPGPVEEAKRAYARDDISEAEFHRQLELHLDERNDRIRTAIEEIDGIGLAKSEAVALQFESLDDLADADREELEAIHGVGESTARAIQQHLDYGREMSGQNTEAIERTP